MMPKGPKIVIAVDGFSSCGKSTLARALAKALDYTYIDSGAMYRAVTHYFLTHQVPLHNEQAVQAALKNIHIQFAADGGVQLNGAAVEQAIRGPEVSGMVSPVAALSPVRRFLVQQQQALGAAKGIVMDGRDIGTVVFPQAEVKIFLTADLDIRTTRRFQELQQKGVNMSRTEVAENLSERDRIDSTREDSPLSKAKDAVVLDNSHISREEQLAMILALCHHRILHAAP